MQHWPEMGYSNSNIPRQILRVSKELSSVLSIREKMLDPIVECNMKIVNYLDVNNLDKPYNNPNDEMKYTDVPS